jgi:ABC-type transport system involved in cytochrome c biogenesis permease subunit
VRVSNKWWPWLAVGIFAAWILAAFLPAREGDGFKTRDFARLPVLLNGRIQPLDSVARNSLLSMRGKQTVAKENGPSIAAREWLLEVMLRPEEADQYKSFRVQHPDVQSLVHAPSTKGIQYLSFNEIAPHLRAIQSQATPIFESERQKRSSPSTRTPFQKDLMHLYASLYLYHQLKNSLQPEDTAEFVKQHQAIVGTGQAAQEAGFLPELRHYKSAIDAGLPALKKSEADEPHDRRDLQLLVAFFHRYQALEDLAYPLIIPPLYPDEPREDWKNIGRALLETLRSGEIHPATQFYARMSSAYAGSRPEEFNRALAEYRTWLAGRTLDVEVRKGQNESFFNHLEPFYKATVIYVAALLLGCAYWLKLSGWVRRSAFYLLVLAFVIHTLGLIFRMFLEGRPPVTNLYSSAIFVGWGAVLLGIVLERIYRDGIGTVASSTVGFTTQIVAHHLALGGDTMEMLRAVLDTNFWLATHVIVITAGYSAMFFAGFLAIVYVLRGLLTKSLDERTAQSMSRMVYGVICFATLFSFAGTILGGIWADQSWGRFWGWDPKENGALLIVIWCAIILHARWGRLINDRVLMALAIFGNVITSFSWFGVNMLGVGLHSYGFMDQAFKWLMLFVGSQMIFIGLALLPIRYWRSFRALPHYRDKLTGPDAGAERVGTASSAQA